MNKIDYHPDNSPDGVFWMNIEDFVWEFKYLYICRVLSEDDGWKSVKLPGSWKGESSAGFRKLSKLPQYKIRITKPCKGFIMLRQHTELSTFRGKNTIMWMCAAEDGDKIAKVNRDTLMGKSSLINLNMVTEEINFKKKDGVSFPCEFTLLCGSKTAGPGGEGDFDVSVYSMDDKMQVVPMGKSFK